MARSLIAALGDVDRYLPWTTIGRHVGLVRALAREQGHQPQRWNILFPRRSAYRVYWTRCPWCGADGRLIASRESSGGPATYHPMGAMFTQRCRGPTRGPRR